MEEIILSIIVNYSRDSSIVTIRIFPRIFLHLELKFTSDMREFILEVCILLILVRFGTYKRGKIVGGG